MKENQKFCTPGTTPLTAAVWSTLNDFTMSLQIATYLQIFNHSQFIVKSLFHSTFCRCMQDPRVGDESYPGCCAYGDGMVSVETMKDCSLQGEHCGWRDRFRK